MTKKLDTVIRTPKRLTVCYAMHPSLEEIVSVIEYLRPKILTPLVMPFASSLQEIKEAFRKYCGHSFIYNDYRTPCEIINDPADRFNKKSPHPVAKLNPALMGLVPIKKWAEDIDPDASDSSDDEFQMPARTTPNKKEIVIQFNRDPLEDSDKIDPGHPIPPSPLQKSHHLLHHQLPLLSPQKSSMSSTSPLRPLQDLCQLQTVRPCHLLRPPIRSSCQMAPLENQLLHPPSELQCSTGSSLHPLSPLRPRINPQFPHPPQKFAPPHLNHRLQQSSKHPEIPPEKRQLLRHLLPPPPSHVSTRSSPSPHSLLRTLRPSKLAPNTRSSRSRTIRTMPEVRPTSKKQNLRILKPSHSSSNN
ncbi:Protein artemis [Folsomia candida]|uniref:Protein artemis n=1 Tax=Folsomia candida TaxID=158441 RepID=A0A226DKP6_FOLCA|nr:Protein artemis [Folsomia candida]